MRQNYLQNYFVPISSQTNDYASMIQGEINCGAQFDPQFDGLLHQSTVISNQQRPNENRVPPPLPPGQQQETGARTGLGSAKNSPHFGRGDF